MQGNTGDQSASVAGEVCLENSSVAISFLPNAGGNISSITDRRSGRNWLWQNSHLPIANNRIGEDYGRTLDSGGWDEMLLSITASEVETVGAKRARIADHGDLIRQQWNAVVCRDTKNGHACRMTAGGEALNYNFVRMVRLHPTAPKITFDYSLTNNESFAWPFYWCPHALLDAHPGMLIDLPKNLPCHVDGAAGQTTDRWPQLMRDDGSSIDLANSFGASDEPIAHKIFVQAPIDGSVSVAAPDSNERFTMTFDPDVIPWIGLWINNRGWSGCGSEPYRNLGLEPSTTNYDCVAAAVANEAIELIQPAETREWTLTVELNQ